MFSSFLRREFERRGAALLGVGLAVILLAQWQSGVPIATAIVLIGWGASLSIASRPQSDVLGLLNLPVYGILGSLAIASQTHASLESEAGQVSLPLLVDHALAIVLLVGLTLQTVQRLLEASADQ